MMKKQLLTIVLFTIIFMHLEYFSPQQALAQGFIFNPKLDFSPKLETHKTFNDNDTFNSDNHGEVYNTKCSPFSQCYITIQTPSSKKTDGLMTISQAENSSSSWYKLYKNFVIFSINAGATTVLLCIILLFFGFLSSN
ncbi:hypothetical protein NIES2098_04420 [Calothrix sp. NIES-2098]|nr:hypothetical protein NIES2098_04420 [Calothrix sp. NIES-2098]